LMVAEGLNVFRVGIASRLAGKPLAASAIREETGCSIIAVQSGDRFDINPDPAKPLPRQGELIVIGDVEAEIRFLQKYAVQPIL
jgi:voltage-gated potassium channel